VSSKLHEVLHKHIVTIDKQTVCSMAPYNDTTPGAKPFGKSTHATTEPDSASSTCSSKSPTCISDFQFSDMPFLKNLAVFVMNGFVPLAGSAFWYNRNIIALQEMVIQNKAYQDDWNKKFREDLNNLDGKFEKL